MTSNLPRERSRLYLVTPPSIDDIDGFVGKFEAAIEGGDIASLQVRMKQGDAIDTAQTRQVAQAVLPLCQANDIALFINDSPQLCEPTSHRSDL